jgi:signal transduction histidine kinase
MDPYLRPSPSGRTAGPRRHRKRRRRAPPASPQRPPFLHYLVTAAQVNLYIVAPLSLLLFVLSEGHRGRSFSWYLWVVLVVANCNVALVTAFYWTARRWRPRSRTGYLALGGLVLPGLGLASASLADLVVRLVTPALPRAGWASSVAAISVVFAVLYGLGLYRSRGFSQAQRVVLRRLRSSQELQHRAEGARDQAKVASLQSLIKPHFVFNTLNAITTLIHEDPQRAEEVTLRLARLMRYLLELEDGELMSLESEVGVVRAYLEIEKVRMGERLHYQVDVAHDLLPLAIPSMVLQPLVENAVKHGASERAQGGAVCLRASADGDYCLIEIVDNGPGFSEGTGVGRSMRLVRDRLGRLYGRDYELRLERDHGTSETIATLRLPVALRPAPRGLGGPERPASPSHLDGPGAEGRPT